MRARRDRVSVVGRGKETLASAPIRLTQEELQYHELWMTLVRACSCIKNNPKDKDMRKALREFERLYGKIDAAGAKAEAGKVPVLLGTNTLSKHELILKGPYYHDSKSEDTFHTMYFMAYMAHRAVKDAAKEIDARMHQLTDIIREQMEQMDRYERRIESLKRALAKARDGKKANDNDKRVNKQKKGDRK